jgi:hypothetical protein
MATTLAPIRATGRAQWRSESIRLELDTASFEQAVGALPTSRLRRERYVKEQLGALAAAGRQLASAYVRHGEDISATEAGVHADSLGYADRCARSLRVQLEYERRFARTLRFTAAAEHIGMGSTTIRNAIVAMNDSLGIAAIPLFPGDVDRLLAAEERVAKAALSSSR